MENYHETEAFLSGQALATPLPGDEVVISGLAGVFPDSKNVYHFRDNLYNKVDMVSCDNRRWDSNHPEVPHRTGKVFDIEKFDAGYFGTHYRQASSMDPLARVFLERSVEAVIDAGIHPSELEGTKTGVFVGACFSESEKTWFFDAPQSQHFSLTGNERSMIANRISFHLKLAGPSFIADTACSSSLYALEQAYKAIRTGVVDMAIVGGTNVVLHPFVSLQFMRLGVLSTDGACKVFDEKGDGYARSEAIAAIFLQRAKDSRRIYSTVVHAKTNCDGYKPQSITYPSGEAQKRLLQEFYEECGVDPTTLSFLEAHGTGTVVGDPEELHAIDEVFCKKRPTPLLVGSVKSNIGHTEPSSGLCSITKCILGMEYGLIPPNIHYNSPRKGIEALEKGRLQVVSEKTPLQDDRGLMAVNSFGFGGGNAHILLRWHKKLKQNGGIPKDDLPRLVCVSSRITKGTDIILDDIISRPLDAEYIRLYHEIFSKPLPGYFYRKFSIISKLGELKRSQVTVVDVKQPLYLAFTGFGLAYSKLANQMYILPLFAASIQRIHNILSPKGVNVTEIVLNGSKGGVFNEIIGIMSVQIALSDIFKVLEIAPEGYFGLGFGEFLCGYFQGSLSLEETVLSIYHIAYQYQEFNKPKILEILSKIINKPKRRSASWLSSVASKLASPEHFVDTLSTACPQLHLEHHLPKDAVIVQLGNQQLDFGNYSTIAFDKIDSFVDFLAILGELHQKGHNFMLDRLYPKVQYPVSRGTPMISPLVTWEHDRDWFVTYYENHSVIKTGERCVSLTLLDDDWAFVGGHVIDGRSLFPATGYLVLAWETLAHISGIMTTEMQVILEDCKFLRATTVPMESKIKFVIMVQRGSGQFEVIESDTVVVTGRVRAFKKGTKEQIDLPLPPQTNEGVSFKTKDIYKELRLRGYNYKGKFRRVLECDPNLSKGLIEWDSNWITFMDSMLQIKILQADTRNLYVPTGVSRISIDAKEHLKYVQNFGENPILPVYAYKDTDMLKCGGIEIRGLSVSSIARRKPRGEPVLEKYQFVPNEAELSTEHSVRVNMQLILENLPGFKIKTVELIDDATPEDSQPISRIIHEVLGDLPLIQPSITLLTKQELQIPNVTVEDKKLITETDCTLVVGSCLLQRIMILNQAFAAIKQDAFVLSREPSTFDPHQGNMTGLTILTIHTVNSEKWYLLRKNTDLDTPTIIDITTTSKHDFPWLSNLQKSVANDSHILVVAQNEPLSGILGLVNCIRREPNQSIVRAVYTFDGAPPFDPHHPFYSHQLSKNLAINVYKNGEWGTYRHLLLDSVSEVEREHCFGNAIVRGDLSSLKWVEGPLSHDKVIPPEKELVYVYNCALNFRDIMSASGRINADVIVKDRTEQEFIHGFEFSGRTKDGRRVMGIVNGALSTLLLADRYLLWPCPDSWSLEEAATIPVVYSTVLYALIIECNIRKGQSILIHAGSGGVGQAAIGLCLYLGLTVFTTVGTKEKRDFLKKRFPQLNDRHIGNSRDTSFEQMIHTGTKGRGVDYVLNSLAEEKLLASVRCLAFGGHFLEIGKFDLASNNSLKLKLLEKDAVFHGIMVDAVFFLDPKSKLKIRNLMTEGIINGSIKPIVRTIFQMEEIEKAFRFMAAGKHIGKILIQIRPEEPNKLATPTLKTFKAVPRFSCDSEKVHVIIGGLGGFGLELADWLVLRGARHLVLTSRKGVTTGYQGYRIKTWSKYGTNTYISTADVTTNKGCRQLIEEAQSFGEIQSIFNLAVVLKDGLFENQTEETFRESLGPKAFATWNLDEVTREMCPNLRDFVIFSSVSCGRGNAGQSNYGMANSVMERVCERRTEVGLPATAIQWGAIGDVGLVAELQEEHTELEIGGTLQQRITSCLQVLDTLMIQPAAIVASMVVAEKRGGPGGADNIVDAVANILGLGDLKTVSLHAALSELGMDSMTAVEIKQTLEREYEVFLTPHDIRNLTFAKLKEIQEERADEDESTKKNRALGGFEMIVRLMNDEPTSRIPLIRLKSRLEEQAPGPKMIVFPGIEGVAKVMAPLAANLEAHVYCLQFLYEDQKDTIHDMAVDLLPRVEALLNKDEKFNMLAYSFGVCVALEVLALLEAKGYSGTIIAVDGAPDMLNKLLINSLDVNSEAIFQTSFIIQLMSLHVPIEVVMKHREVFLMSKSFEDRLNIGAKLLPKDTPYSVSYMRVFAIALYKRLHGLNKYQLNCPKIKSVVRLFKPQNTSIPGLTEDYKLTDFCENVVDIRVFPGNHATILENVEMSDLINSLIMANTQFVKESLLGDEGGKLKMPQIAEIKQI